MQPARFKRDSHRPPSNEFNKKDKSCAFSVVVYPSLIRGILMIFCRFCSGFFFFENGLLFGPRQSFFVIQEFVLHFKKKKTTDHPDQVSFLGTYLHTIITVLRVVQFVKSESAFNISKIRQMANILKSNFGENLLEHFELHW